jgi:hypothetical protein
MMHPNDIKLAMAVAAVTVFGALRPGIARADQHIVCPVLAVQLEAAAPILGPINGPEPWGELHSEVVKKKGGALVNKYNLTGGVAPQLEKWMICYYRDGSHKAVKLPTKTKECGVTNKREGADPVTKETIYRVFDISCE